MAVGATPRSRAPALRLWLKEICPARRLATSLSRLTSVPPANSLAGLTGHGRIVCEGMGSRYRSPSSSHVGLFLHERGAEITASLIETHGEGIRHSPASMIIETKVSIGHFLKLETCPSPSSMSRSVPSDLMARSALKNGLVERRAISCTSSGTTRSLE